MARYDAYLLRVWRAAPGDVARWAGRLEHLPDGHCRRFGSLETLLAHLRQLLAVECDDPAATGVPEGHETPAEE